MASHAELIFQTRFEGTTRVKNNVSKSGFFDIGGTTAGLPKSDWVKNTKGSPYIDVFNFRYGPNSIERRSAKIIKDPLPDYPTDKALMLQINDTKYDNGRIQSHLKTSGRIRAIYIKQRIYFPESLQQLKQYPGSVSWFILSEFWDMGISKGERRIGVNISKTKGKGKELVFRVYSGFFKTASSSYYHKVKVPVGWATFEYYLRGSSNRDGHFFAAITPQGGKRIILANYPNITTSVGKKYTPYNNRAKGCHGFTNFSPIKLYVAKRYIDFMRNRGSAVTLGFDDLQVYRIKE